MLRALSFLEQGDWQAAHEIVQKGEQSPPYCWAHGIVHLMEGDLPNAGFWYRQANRPFPPDPAPLAEVEQLRKALFGL